ncbi:leucine-rich repeat protein [Ruminococcus flavefaciens]|uniref:leucine-rich repeat protein n=1 Tax=Ruminococcus flavefaciens TaxID=1265 RepID=UPI0004AD76EF|nr:leucine-rich repeat protein [Ruminococcus flavefaciens]
MKKVVSAVISAAICFSAVLTFPVMAAGVPLESLVVDSNVGESGTCGANAAWSLEDGTLTISGSGKLVNWASSAKVPWNSLRGKIKTVVIEKGITSIGPYAFLGCANLSSVNISDTVTDIGMSTFVSCTSLASVDFPASVSTIGREAFKNCASLSTVTIRNKNCNIVGYSLTICNSSANDKGSFSGTIIGEANSTAQTFAQNYGYNFKLLGSQPEITTTATSTTTTTTTTSTTSKTTTTTTSTTSKTTTTTTTSTTSKTTTTTTNAPTTTSIASTTVPITTTTPDPHTEEYMLGDVNGDKLIDSVDASKVLAEYAAVSSGKASKFNDREFAAADVDKNGMADSVDASKILAYYAYSSSENGNVKSLSEFLKK